MTPALERDSRPARALRIGLCRPLSRRTSPARPGRCRTKRRVRRRESRRCRPGVLQQRRQRAGSQRPRLTGRRTVQEHGSSCGTRLAQTVMSDVPQGDRSIVLSGSYPAGRLAVFARGASPSGAAREQLKGSHREIVQLCLVPRPGGGHYAVPLRRRPFAGIQPSLCRTGGGFGRFVRDSSHDGYPRHHS